MIALNTVLSRIRKIGNACKNELIHFLFPVQCLHCQEVDVDYPMLFCNECKHLIERVPLKDCKPFQAVSVVREGLALSLLKEVRKDFFKKM